MSTAAGRIHRLGGHAAQVSRRGFVVGGLALAAAAPFGQPVSAAQPEATWKVGKVVLELTGKEAATFKTLDSFTASFDFGRDGPRADARLVPAKLSHVSIVLAQGTEVTSTLQDWYEESQTAIERRQRGLHNGITVTDAKITVYSLSGKPRLAWNLKGAIAQTWTLEAPRQATGNPRGPGQPAQNAQGKISSLEIHANRWTWQVIEEGEKHTVLDRPALEWEIRAAPE